MAKAFDRLDVMATSGKVRLVVLWKDSFVTWAVYAPDTFGRMTYFAQPNEAEARNFYTRLVALLTRPGG